MPSHDRAIKLNKPARGKFITIEGIDGCGKSTLAANLTDALVKTGASVVLTKEPGGSELGQSLRKILNERKEQKDPVCEEAEFLLFAADRAQHFKQLIQPDLATNKIVISDRWSDSSVAYQGYGRGLDITMIKTINRWVTQGLVADLTFYIRIDAQTAFDRIKKRNLELTAFEKEKVEFWKRVEQGYEELFMNRKNVAVLDGKMTQEELLKQALSRLLPGFPPSRE
jgi:dTMP kinase